MRVGWASEDYVTSGAFLTPGGCTFYRCMLPSNTVPGSAVGKPAFMSMHGFGVRINAQQARFGFDVIIFKQVMHKWIPKQIEIAKQLGQIIVTDVDDHFDMLHDDNRAKEITDPELNPVANRNYLRQVIDLSDMIICSTPELLNYYSSLHPNVRLVRNSISPDMFTPNKPTAGKPVVGWVGATSWRSGDVETLRPWLGDWLERHDLMFHHAGWDPNGPLFSDLAGIDPDRMMMSPMRPLPQYPEMMLMDIGLVPLSMHPFNEAKSCLKGLEYAASGIPFVAAGTGEYRLLASQGIGRVAGSPDEWVQHMDALLDVGLRKREARRNRGLVLRDHTIVARAQDWVNVLSEYAGHRCQVPSVIESYRSVAA